MTKIINNLFNKDNESLDNDERERYAVKSVIVGIITNIILFGVKLVIGLILNSVAIMVDSFNNLSDCLTNFVSLIGIKLGNKPADSEHPFGHGRLEYFSALVISFSILYLGFEFLRVSIHNILNPEEIGFNLILIGILLFTMVIKVCLYFFYKRIGNKIDSKAIIATAKDSINDVLITAATILSIVFTYLTGTIIDGYIGVIVASMLIYSGFTITRDTVSKLLGESIDPGLAKEISSIAEAYKQILGTHDLIVHNYGPTSSMATIHVELSNKMSIDEAHYIVDKIEREVKSKLGITLVIHVDPIPVNDDRVNELKFRVIDYINSVDPKLDAHDFKVIDRNEHTDVIFEIEFPYNYDKDKENIILLSLSSIVKSLDKKYNCIIEPEYRFIKDS